MIAHITQAAVIITIITHLTRHEFQNEQQIEVKPYLHNAPLSGKNVSESVMQLTKRNYKLPII